MNRIPRRIFSAEFKREAVQRITKQGLPLGEVGKKLDVAIQSLRTWMAPSERGDLKASLGASKRTADQHRLRELERELALAKMERLSTQCLESPPPRLPNPRGTDHVERRDEMTNAANRARVTRSHVSPD